MDIYYVNVNKHCLIDRIEDEQCYTLARISNKITLFEALCFELLSQLWYQIKLGIKIK